jgi:aspartyl-tRNA(Asn)/glutamyl-tRNA(Gln) amidotransferase subunit C
LENIKISKDEVAWVAHLARLEFKEEEMEKFTAQMNDILGYMDKLSETDAADVEPLANATLTKNAFRTDAVGESLFPEQALANAPEVRGGFFQVPKIID